MDGQVRNEAQLAARLEKELPDPVRMVQIHPFSYAMFGSAALKAADLYIVPDSDRYQCADWFAADRDPVPAFEPGTGAPAFMHIIPHFFCSVNCFYRVCTEKVQIKTGRKPSGPARRGYGFGSSGFHTPVRSAFFFLSRRRIAAAYTTVSAPETG